MEFAFAPQLERRRAAVRAHPAQEKQAKTATAAGAMQRKPAEPSGLPPFLGRAVERAQVQAKLTVGAVGDPFEQEADRIAAAVLAGRASQRDVGGATATARGVNRRWSAAAAPSRSTLLPASAGEPMDPAVRARIEPLLGADLSDVRVHRGADAHQMAGELSARAFTHENHIYLGERESAGDVGLLAHEATHVVQQTGEGRADPAGATLGGARGTIQRQFFWAHTQHPNQPAYPRQPHLHPDVDCDPRALAAIDTQHVELKGTGTFNPPSRAYLLGMLCAYPEPVLVRAQFGNLARGFIRVYAIPVTVIPPDGPPWTGVTFQTASNDEHLELRHPSFPGAGFHYPPMLKVRVDAGVVTGHISFTPNVGRIEAFPGGFNAWNAGLRMERLLGWNGLNNVQANNITNELRDGVLRYALTGFTYQQEDTTYLGGGAPYNGPDALRGTGDFSVTDERESFSANTSVQGEGVVTGDLPLRKVADRISGSASFSLNLAPRRALGGTISGSIEGNFARGVLTLQGTARYASRKVNGSVTLLFAPRDIAWQRVIARLPAGTAPPINPTARAVPGYVLVGWGTVNFSVNEWLTGSVSAVMDPEGEITTHGILRPQREFRFLQDGGNWSAAARIPRIQGSVTILPIVPVIASISGYATADLIGEGRIGPVRVYDLEVQGVFSTRPGTIVTGSATGRVNISAWGRLRAELGSGIAFTVVGGRAGSVAIEGTASLTARAYAELQPTIERMANPSNPEEPQYRIRGALTVAGAADFGLTGGIVIRLAGVRIWRRSLGSLQWSLGSLGMRADLAYTIGSNDPVTFTFGSADFESHRFGSTVENLMGRRPPRSDRNHDASLEQDPSTVPGARPDTPTSLEQRFTMGTTPHRLWVEHVPNAVIKMASDGDDKLSDKLRAEERSIQGQRDAATGGAAAELADQQGAVRRLEGQTTAVERSLNELQSESREAGDVGGMRELADGLTAYGAQNDKEDLADPPPPPVDPEIVDGRYVITNQAQLDAVTRVAPQLDHPPGGLSTREQAWWQRYAESPGGYFAERLRLIGQDIQSRGTTARDGPQTWAAYIVTRSTTDDLLAAKAFQPELRDIIINEDRRGVEPRNVEIDVGVRPTRPGVSRETRYPDVVVTDDGNGGIEVWSAKVRNVRAQVENRAALPPEEREEEVRTWIRGYVEEDINNAVTYYAHELEFRRAREADPATGRPNPSGGRHPLLRQRRRVTQVNVVWRYSRDLIPGLWVAEVEEAGQEFGVRRRRRAAFPVQFLLRPQPPPNPPD